MDTALLSDVADHLGERGLVGVDRDQAPIRPDAPSDVREDQDGQDDESDAQPGIHPWIIADFDAPAIDLG